MALPVSFRWDEELVARIDEARGDVPRSVFVRRAVERALRREDHERRLADVAETDVSPATVPAPAGPTRDQIYWRPGSSEERLLLGRNADSSQSKRDVRPRPKGGK